MVPTNNLHNHVIVAPTWGNVNFEDDQKISPDGNLMIRISNLVLAEVVDLCWFCGQLCFSLLFSPSPSSFFARLSYRAGLHARLQVIAQA